MDEVSTGTRLEPDPAATWWDAPKAAWLLVVGALGFLAVGARVFSTVRGG